MASSDQDRIGSTDCKPKTWEVVNRPPEFNIVSSKYFSKVKRNHTGAIERFKVRIVARGFSHVHGVDYEENYFCGHSDWQCFCARSCKHLLPSHCVRWRSNAYVKGTIKEKIYMETPPELELPQDKVLLLLKTLYGLKQPGWCCNDRINNYLESI